MTRDVEVSELEAHLSEYVERAARGEVIRVTDHGVPRVLLSPLRASDQVDRGLAEGWITRQERRAPGPARPVEAPPGPAVTRLLDEDRGD